MIVDAHVHLLPERLASAIRGFFLEHIVGELAYPHESGPALAALRAAGVSRCWSLPYVRRPGAAQALNRWQAETFADEPFVAAGATVHPGDDVGALVDEAVGPLGLALFKLHCSVGEFEPDDPRLEALWQRVSRTGHPVVVHAGHSVAGTTTAADLAPIGRVAGRWPDARLVVAHCGAPAVAETLTLMRRHGSLFADLAPVVVTACPLERAAIEGLEERILYGSDMPNVAVPIESGLSAVRSLGLGPEHERAILGGNAERLLADGGAG